MRGIIFDSGQCVIQTQCIGGFQRKIRWDPNGAKKQHRDGMHKLQAAGWPVVGQALESSFAIDHIKEFAQMGISVIMLDKVIFESMCRLNGFEPVTE